MGRNWGGTWGWKSAVWNKNPAGQSFHLSGPYGS